MGKKNRLGRGMASLLGNFNEHDNEQKVDVVKVDSGLLHLPLSQIITDPNQPRKFFAEENMNDLINSIKEKGVIIPIIVRIDESNPHHYIIVAGERRFRAAKAAGLSTIPAICKNLTSNNIAEYAIIENIQRHDLSAIEEALAYEKLIETFDYTQNDVAKMVGKSRSHVANVLRLLKLPENVKELIVKHGISMGHARALMSTKNPLKIARSIVAGDLSVREVEKIAKADKKPTSQGMTMSQIEESLLAEMLSDQLGLKVEVRNKSNDRGTIMIEYRSYPELDRIIAALSITKKG